MRPDTICVRLAWLVEIALPAPTRVKRRAETILVRIQEDMVQAMLDVCVPGSAPTSVHRNYDGFDRKPTSCEGAFGAEIWLPCGDKTTPGG